MLYPDLILDLDDTCLNTRILKDRLFACLVDFILTYIDKRTLERSPLSIDQLVHATYQECRQNYHPSVHLESILRRLSITTTGLAEYRRLFAEKLRIVFSNLKSLIFPDANQFIRENLEKGRKVILLTHGNPDFQSQKIASTFLPTNPNQTRNGNSLTVLICSDGNKAAVLNDFYGENAREENFIFVDNEPRHLQTIKESFPYCQAVLIDRYHNAGEYEKQHPESLIINTFKELELDLLSRQVRENKEIARQLERPPEIDLDYLPPKLY